jgi:hypothetical protein
MSISGQDPEWFLCIDVENKIELFKPFRMPDLLVRVEISDSLRRLHRCFREEQGIDNQGLSLPLEIYSLNKVCGSDIQRFIMVSLPV